ncbi:CBS domain-containing protein [Mobilitalea sibirica]|uniref:CBS domain-containing protein n=1 Tax=Mobilitalea sibirica TaxID=1462919 RepID=A0A8J7L091_9FIRM|nr:CBS domain-containing protein [Mobilitalea sibirica]MBH1941868.1 CBS domain-containing protein [Mobilitalea sibirica]
MNIAFFLTPKSEIVWVENTFTVRQTMEKMEHHRYSAIPILNKTGKYIGTITEGDLLWYFKNGLEITFKDTSKISINTVKRYKDNKPISINSQIEDIISLAILQGFIPVVDDQNIFIGIIKRSTIIKYFMDRQAKVSIK